MRGGMFVLGLVATIAVVGPAASGAGRARAERTDPATSAPPPAIAEVTRGVPLHFEENVGQHDPAARFLARSRGFRAWFTDGEVVLEAATGDATRDVLRVRVPRSDVAPRGGALLPGRSNYFLGNDPSKWVTDAPHRADVTYTGVAPGVDVVWRSAPGARLEYVVHAEPGADVGRFEFALSGADAVDVAPDGDLVVATPGGEFRHGRPVAWQDTAAGRRPVACRFDVRTGGRVGFAVGPHDRSLGLTIDPTIVWATRYGTTEGANGYADRPLDLAVDSSGAAYVSGWTDSASFPCVSAYQSSRVGSRDGVIVKIDAEGTAATYATYFGGTDGSTLVTGDGGEHIAVDSSGAAVVHGHTNTTDFPTTSNALVPTDPRSSSANQISYVLKLSASGNSLAYSTYFDRGDIRDIALNSSDRAVLAGTFGSSLGHSATATSGVFQPTFGGGLFDAFVAELSSTGSALLTYTFLGGPENDGAYAVAVDGSDNVLVAGGSRGANFPCVGAFQRTFGGAIDAFVAKIAADGSSLLWSSYLGGGVSASAYEAGDTATDIAADSMGDVYVCGYTFTSDFPTTSRAMQTTISGVEDAFITKVRSDGSALIWSTYLGGSGGDRARRLSVARDRSVWVAGTTDSTDFPTTGTESTGGCFYVRVSSDGATLRTGSRPYYRTSEGGGASVSVVNRPGHGTYFLRTSGGTSETVNALSEVGGLHVTKLVAELPTAPTSVAVSAQSERRLRVTWMDTSTEEESLELERAPAGGTFVRIGEVEPDTTSFTDTGLAGETSYDYRVRAVNESGSSAWSTVARGTTGPAAPTGVGGTTLSNTRVALSWIDVSATETSFQVERRAESATAWTSVGSAAANATSLTDTAAPPESVIRYRVRAGHAVAPSEWSAEATVTTAPANPRGRTPFVAPSGAVSVTWDDLSMTEKGYELQRAPGWPGTAWTTIALLPPNATAYADPAVEPESVYSYRIRAFNDFGTSDWVDLGHLTTGPYAPEDLVAEALSPTRVAVSWTDRSKMELGYEVLRSEDGVFVPVADLAANATGLTEGSLSQETGYTYRVRTFNQHGKSAWAEVAVKTPSALVVRSAKVVRGKGKKPKPSVLTATGEFDTGGTGIDLASEATFVVGETEISLSGLTFRKGVYRFTSGTFTLDLVPSKTGQSRVTFKLTMKGAAVDALAPDGETVFCYRNAPLDASAVVALSADRFAIGRNRLVDPALVVSSFSAALRGKGKDSLLVTGYFDASEGVRVPGPDVVVRLEGFEFVARGTEFRTAGSKATFSIAANAGGVRISRKVVLDSAKGTVTVKLTGADLGEFEPGAVPVSFSLEVGDAKCGDTYVASSTGKSLRY